MADLVAVMCDGELQQVAPPHEIYDRPANRFVATFVGSPPMNRLGAASDDDGLRVGGATLPLNGSAARRVPQRGTSRRSASGRRMSASVNPGARAR